MNNEMILETIITTVDENCQPQIAPMGVWWQDDHLVLAPFKPSTTLDNLQATGHAVVNFTDDVSVFAGCLTGRYDWPLAATENIQGNRLHSALRHIELTLVDMQDDELRPKCLCAPVLDKTHAPFNGYNRAQAAVLELAILVSRLHMLEPEKVHREIEYLTIAVDKTAGPRERQAWSWLMKRVDDYFLSSAAV